MNYHCPYCKTVHNWYDDCQSAARLAAERAKKDLVKALMEHAELEATTPDAADYLRSIGVEAYSPIVVTGDMNKLKVGKRVRIDAFVKIEIGEGVEICDDTHIASFAHLNIGGGYLRIGHRCGIASGVKIVTGGNDVDAPSMTATAPGTSRTYKSVVGIADDCSVLVNAVILPNAFMGPMSRLAAGAILTSGKATGAQELWKGVPARYDRRLRG